MTEPLTPVAARVAAALRDCPRQRVYLSELWTILDQADPASRTAATRRMLLDRILTELAQAHTLDLPSPRSYDRTAKPHLPRFINRTVDPKPAPTVRRPAIWHPSLAWVADATVTPTQRDHLETVNQWLHTNRDDLIVPLRERSLDIFGTEKTLDRLLPTSLFAPDRLALDLLRTRRSRVRFTTEHIGNGDGLLIVENSDTFDSLTTALRHHNQHDIGVIGWGAGAAFEASVLSIPLLPRPPRFITYFGDLDDKGLRIPANAHTLAARDNLPPIRPAIGLYDALLRLGRPAAGQRRLTDTTATEVTVWLDAQHRAAAAAHLTGGTRLAQEAVGLAHLLRHDDWLADLVF
ncbi:MAG: DUF2220 family protein [Actinomycetota bacterium]|nr:DUF2220 family protein [Actinomycetota bacterium]MDQ2957297.1 DUF2220 family protein [Actinomycetota bacterium]